MKTLKLIIPSILIVSVAMGQSKVDTINVMVRGVNRKAIVRLDTIFIDGLRTFTPVFRTNNKGEIYIYNQFTNKYTLLK